MTLPRRTLLIAALGALSGAWPRLAAAETSPQAATSRMTAYGFSFAGLKGGDIRLMDYAGRPILVVNTASQCGFTPQLAGLQALWSEFRDRGLVIIGVPSNDFGQQEPGSPDDIEAIAHGQFGISFPLAAKSVVKGPKAHPFYRWAAEARPRDLPRWNFHKYLVGRDGYLADAFATEVEPGDTRVKTAIGRALGAA